MLEELNQELKGGDKPKKGKSPSSFLESLNSELANPKSHTGQYAKTNAVTDINEYDADLNITPDLDLSDSRANRQSSIDKLANGILVRLPHKVYSELGKTAGMVTGVGEAMRTGDISKVIDNSVIRMFENQEEEVKKMFPIYTPKYIKEGSFSEQIQHLDFYMDEGVDGLGFLLSAFVGTKGIGAVGAGGKVARAANLGKKVGQNLDLIGATAVQTIYEAGTEARGVKDEVLEKLSDKVQAGEITQEEAQRRAAIAAKDTFLGNMGVLIGPNLIMSKFMLGKWNTTKSALQKAFAGEQSSLLGNMAKNLVIGTTSEGLFEEGSQTAITNYSVKKALGKDQGYAAGFLTEYLDMLGTTDGQKSVFLGALLGGGVGSISGYFQDKQENQQISSLKSLFDKHLEDYNTDLGTLYKRDANGQLVMKNGAPQYDINKLKEQSEYVFKTLAHQEQLEDAILTNNKEKFEAIKNDMFLDFAMPFLKEEGGVKILNDHIDKIAEKELEEYKQVYGEFLNLEDLKGQFKAKATKMQSRYNYMDDKGAGFFNLKLQTKPSTLGRAEEQQVAAKFINDLKYQQLFYSSRKDFHKQRIGDLTIALGSIDHTDTIEAKKAEEIKSSVTQHQEALDHYEKLAEESFNTKLQQKKYDQMIANRIKLQEESTKVKTEEPVQPTEEVKVEQPPVEEKKVEEPIMQQEEEVYEPEIEGEATFPVSEAPGQPVTEQPSPVVETKAPSKAPTRDKADYFANISEGEEFIVDASEKSDILYRSNGPNKAPTAIGVYDKQGNLNTDPESLRKAGILADRLEDNDEVFRVVKSEEPTDITQIPFAERLPALIKAGVVSHVYRSGKRPIVVFSINGNPLPFYRSSEGTDGKGKGKWYPFFGFGKRHAVDTDVTWLIKPSILDLEANIGSDVIAAYSALANKLFNWDHDLDLKAQNPFINNNLTIKGDTTDFNKAVFGREDLGVARDIEKSAGRHIIDSISKIDPNFKVEKQPITPPPIDIPPISEGKFKEVDFDESVAASYTYMKTAATMYENLTEGQDDSDIRWQRFLDKDKSNLDNYLLKVITNKDRDEKGNFLIDQFYTKSNKEHVETLVEGLVKAGTPVEQANIEAREGIVVQLVDKFDKPVLATNEGVKSDKGLPLFTKLVTSEMIFDKKAQKEKPAISPKHFARVHTLEYDENKSIDQQSPEFKIAWDYHKKELKEFNEVLNTGKVKYLPILSKGKGVANIEDRDDYGSIVGRIVRNVNNPGLEGVKFFIPEKSRDNTGYQFHEATGHNLRLGSLYAIIDDIPVQLKPRTLNGEEIQYILGKYSELGGLAKLASSEENNKKMDAIQADIEKFIFTTTPEAKRTPFTLYRKYKKVYFGLTGEADLDSITENREFAEFLATKNRQVDAKLLEKNSKIKDPISGKDILYNEFLFTGDQPAFVTNYPSLDSIQRLNRYLVYDHVGYHRAKPLEAQEEEYTPTETIIAPEPREAPKPEVKKRRSVDLGEAPTGPKFDRLAKGEVTEVEDLASMKSWFESRFDGESFEVVKELIDGRAFGQFYNGLVTLYEKAEVGTGYHEAFHKVTQQYLTKRQLDSLYAETGKTSKIEAEEFLAEDFRQYMLSGQKRIAGKPVRNSIFRKLYRAIVNFLTGKTDIQTIYERLASKRGFSGRAKVNVGYFNKGKLNAVGGFNEAKTKDVFDTISKKVLDVLYINKLTPAQLSDMDSLELSKNITKAYNNARFEIYERAKELNSRIDDLTDEEYDNLLDLSQINKNWDSIIVAHKKYMRTLGMKLTTEINEEEEPNIVPADDPDDIADTDKTEEAFEEKSIDATPGRDGREYTSANEINTITTVSSDTKLLIASLTDVKNGEKVKNSIGEEKLVDFNRTYKYLLWNLKGLTTPEAIFARLGQLRAEEGYVQELMNKLGNPNAPGSESMSFAKANQWMAFVKDFSKTYSTGTITIVNPDNGEIYQIDANKENLKLRIKDRWRTNLLASNYVSKNVSGQVSIKKDVLSIKDNVDFLSAIGIDFEKWTKKELIKEIDPNDVEYIRAGLSRVLQEDQPVNNLFSGEIGEGAPLNNLLELAAQKVEETIELSYKNPEGKTIYAITQNNYFTKVANTINEVKNIDELYRRLPHLNNVWSSSSVWLDSLFDSNGNRTNKTFAFNTVSGVKQKGDEASGVNTTNLHPADKFMQEFTDLLKTGLASVPRPSDKSTEYAAGIVGELVVPITSVSKDFNTQEVRDTFLGYFKSELARIRAFNLDKVGKNIQIYATKEKDKKTGEPIEGSEPAANWVMFDGILSKETKDKLKGYTTMSHEDFALGDGVPDHIIDMVLSDITTKYLPSIASKNKAIMSEYGMLKKTEEKWEPVYKDGKLADRRQLHKGLYPGISNELLANHSIDTLINAFTVNHVIQSIEHHYMFIGDPALYKDEFKRISAYSGNKDFCTTGQFVNKWLNSHKSTKEEITDRFRAVIRADVGARVTNERLQEYVRAVETSLNISKEEAEALLDPYMNMTEADAQAYITLPALRAMAFKAGNWTDLEERQFWYEVAYEKFHKGIALDPSEKLKYTDPNTGKWNPETNPGGVFVTRKAQYAGPQVYDNRINAQTFHKYSLLPIYGRMVAGTNMAPKYEAMLENNVSYEVFGSGVKVGAITKEDGSLPTFYDEKGDSTVIDSETPVQELNYEWLGIQVYIAPKVKKQVLHGTQKRKLVWANIFEDGSTGVEGFEGLHQEYIDKINTLVNRAWDKLKKDIGAVESKDKDGNPVFTFVDFRKLADMARAEAEDRQLADNLIDSIQYEQTNGHYTLKYPIDSLVNRPKIEALFMSIVNSRVLKQKMPGDGMIQAANTGHEKLGNKRRVFDVDKKGNPRYLSNELEFYRKDVNIEEFRDKELSFSKDEITRVGTAFKVDAKSITFDGGAVVVTDSKGARVKVTKSDVVDSIIKLSDEYKDAEKNAKTLPMQVKVPANAQYKVLLDKYGSLSALNEAIKQPDFDKRLIQLVGYRIPTQGLNSIEFMEIVEFLEPESGNTIILPTEIVAKSGGDFDIDKLNIFRPNFTVRHPDGTTELSHAQDRIKKVEEATQEKYGKLTQERYDEIVEAYFDLPQAMWPKEGLESIVMSSTIGFQKYIKDNIGRVEYVESNRNGKQSIQNRIIEITRDILSHQENFAQLITPNTTDTLTGLVAKIRGKRQDKGSKTKSGVIEFPHILDQFKYFLGGKAGVGIAAIHNTFHTIFQEAGTRLSSEHKSKTVEGNVKRSYFTTKQIGDEISLGSKKDVNGKLISDIISQFINAYVDVAKDPFYKDLNAGTDTASIYFYLIHMGVDIESIAYFMNQPIIVDYTNQLQINSSLVKTTTETDLSNFEVQTAIKTKYEGRLKELGQSPLSHTNFKNYSPKENEQLLNWIENTDKSLATIDDVNYLQAQLQFLTNFLDYKAEADNLTSLMRALNSDTNKSITLGDIQERLDNITSVDNLYGTVRRQIERRTILGGFNKLKDTQSLYKDLFVTEQAFKETREKLINEIIKPSTKDEKDRLYTLANNDFINYITQRYSGMYKEIDSLFKGSNSLPKRLEAIKRKGISNPLIEQLQAILTNEEDINNISIYARRLVTHESNVLTSSWRELYDHDDLEVQQFARDLDKFIILQSGLNNSPITFLGLEPYDHYGDLVKVAIDRFKAETFGNPKATQAVMNDFITRFFLKNVHNSTVVPFHKKGKGDSPIAYHLKDKNVLQRRIEDKTYLVNTRGEILPWSANIDIKRYGYKLQNFYLQDNDGNLGKDWYSVEPNNSTPPSQPTVPTRVIESNTGSTPQGSIQPKNEQPIVVKSVDSKYELFPGVYANQGQQEALDLLSNFLKSGEKEFTLIGRGGTGKTTIIKKILAEAKGKNIGGITVAHKAKKVLGKSIGKNRVSTIASALAIKLNEQTGEFLPDEYARKKGKVPIKNLDLIIVDEASMISPAMYAEIMAWKKSTAKVIFMGDNAQLPPVGEDEDSPVFNLENQYTLKEKMRQAATSPIIGIGSVIADNIELDKPKLVAIPDTMRVNSYDKVSGSSVEFLADESEALDKMVEDIKSSSTDPNFVKAVTFNNESHDASQSVKNLNMKIRNRLWGKEASNQFNVGEMLTAYDTFGGEEPVFHNSDDLIVKSVIPAKGVKGKVVVESAAKGARMFPYEYDLVYLELIDDEGNILPQRVPVIANSSKAKFNSDMAELWRKDKQLAFALKANFGDLHYGYAITSHKAQGSTYTNTYVFEDNILGKTNGSTTIAKNKSLYVAVSRPTTKLVMVGVRNGEGSTFEPEISGFESDTFEPEVEGYELDEWTAGDTSGEHMEAVFGESSASTFFEDAPSKEEAKQKVKELLKKYSVDKIILFDMNFGLTLEEIQELVPTKPAGSKLEELYNSTFILNLNYTFDQVKKEYEAVKHLMSEDELVTALLKKLNC